MRETSFIKQNKDKWSDLENVMDQESKDPEKLNELFIKVTDDLSYSRTYYSKRSVRVYLNGLAQRVFYSIYKNRKNRRERLKGFWTTELPRLVYESRVAFRVSFAVFMLSMLIGVISSIYDPDFTQAILGETYVEMTVENIESGDPMAVYKSKGKVGMSVGITLNNILVSFWTFIMGVFCMIGTLGILISNGIMVGSFQHFFYDHGLLRESALTIWMHGTLEISAIIIAGAAGITMGRGLVFPGTLSRLNAFQLSARRGLKIMIGITPIFIVAGFIEGFLTRLTDVPDIIRLIFILICLAFILGYFVWYPVKIGRGNEKLNSGIADLQPSVSPNIDLGKVKKPGELISDLVVFLRSNASYVFGISFIGAVIFTGLSILLGNESASTYFPYQSASSGLALIDRFFANEFIPLLPAINVLVFSTVIYLITARLKRKFSPETQTILNKSFASKTGSILKIFIVSILTAALLYTTNGFTVLFFPLLVPIIFVWAYRSSLPGSNPFQDLSKTFKLVFSNYSQGLAIGAIILLLAGFIIYTFTASLFSYSINVLSWNLPFEMATKEEIVIVIFTFIQSLILLFTFSSLVIFGALYYYSLEEKESANYLKKKVLNIGVKRTLQGLDQENQFHGA